MNVNYEVSSSESESKKKKVLEDILKSLGTKVTIDKGAIISEKRNEMKIVELLVKSGLKFAKKA